MSATEKFDGGVFAEEHAFVVHHRGDRTEKVLIQACRVNGMGRAVYDDLTDAWVEAVGPESYVRLADMC